MTRKQRNTIISMVLTAIVIFVVIVLATSH